ncbi:MAG: tripartite tricarboxylate transporter substrate-binding protein [Roseobacter sp.]
MGLFRKLTLGAAMAAAFVLPAWADYPERAITLVVGSVPGSGPDFLARSMSEELSAELGQPIVVENQPGAAGNLAAAAISRSDPDGYRIYIGTINMTIATWLPAEAPFDPASDFAYVGRVGAIPDVIAVNKSLGIDSIDVLIAKAKSAPGDINFSSPGVGSLQQMGANALMAATGTDMFHVVYKGGKAASTGALSGEVEAGFLGMPPVISLIESGDMVALAVSGVERSPLIPDVPTYSESVVPGYVAEAWYGLFMPKDTPDDIVAKVNAAANAALSNDVVAERFAAKGAVVQTSTPAEFATFVADESARWKAQLEELGLAGTR